jgi:hypothetical protein
MVGFIGGIILSPYLLDSAGGGGGGIKRLTVDNERLLKINRCHKRKADTRVCPESCFEDLLFHWINSLLLLITK